MAGSDYLNRLDCDEAFRLEEFPIARKRIFLSHASVTILPRRVVDALTTYSKAWSEDAPPFTEEVRLYNETRAAAANLIGAQANEIALLGPTTLGISLVANGIHWEPGDEIVCYQDDYPANVYPWMEKERLGVKIVYLQPEAPGRITPELVRDALTGKTRLVALASCHFLTGYRIDIDAIGRLLQERRILFSLDAIQTVGAFETNVRHVDFLSADSHKWMLGPMTAGIFCVREHRLEELRPTLLGAWNVRSPDFITQGEMSLMPSAQRYEPGVLNGFGLAGMRAAIDLLLEIGIPNISKRLLHLKAHLVNGLTAKGYRVLEPSEGETASSITSCTDEDRDMEAVFKRLSENDIVTSLRRDRAGSTYVRFSPHFYNTVAELDRVLALM